MYIPQDANYIVESTIIIEEENKDGEDKIFRKKIEANFIFNNSPISMVDIYHSNNLNRINNLTKDKKY